jgi:hypothetical protein
MKLNKNGQPAITEGIALDATNGGGRFSSRRTMDTGTIVFNTKSQGLRYFEQTKGLTNIEPIPGTPANRRGGIRNHTGESL